MSLTDYLNQSVTIEPWTGADDYDKPTFGTGVAYAARVEGKTTRVRRADGEEAVADTRVYLLPSADGVVSERDRITLPDGSQPEVLAVEAMPDGNGDTHYVKVLTGTRGR